MKSVESIVGPDCPPIQSSLRRISLNLEQIIYLERNCVSDRAKIPVKTSQATKAFSAFRAPVICIAPIIRELYPIANVHSTSRFRSGNELYQVTIVLNFNLCIDLSNCHTPNPAPATSLKTSSNGLRN